MDLKEACQIGNFERIRELFNKGTSIDAICHYACKEGQLDIVKFAFANGADPNAKKGVFLLQASEQGHYKVLHYLLAERNVSYKKKEAFQIACKRERFNCIKVFIDSEKGESRQLYLNNGLTFLCTQEDESTVSRNNIILYFLDEGAVLTARILNHVGHKKNFDLLKLLLRKEVSRCEKNGKKPMEIVFDWIPSCESTDFLQYVMEKWKQKPSHDQLQNASLQGNIPNLDYLLSKLDYAEVKSNYIESVILRIGLSHHMINLTKYGIQMLKKVILHPLGATKEKQEIVSNILERMICQCRDTDSIKLLVDEGAVLNDTMIDRILNSVEYINSERRFDHIIHYLLRSGVKPSSQSFRLSIRPIRFSVKIPNLLLRYNAPLPHVEDLLVWHHTRYFPLVLFTSEIGIFLSCVEKEKYLDMDSIVFDTIGNEIANAIENNMDF